MNNPSSAWVSHEQSLLGALLLDDAAFWKVADRIEATDFGADGHAELWGVIREMAQAGKPRDAVTISDLLTNRGLAQRVGGVSYLIELANNAPGSANVVAYADLVLRAAEHRRVIAAGQRIAKLGPDEADQASRILAAATKPKGTAVQHIASVLGAWHSDLERRFQGAEITGISTGLPKLDEITGGLQDGDLIILAARPSMGKSALAGQIADCAAAANHPAAVFSLEMPAAQFANRMIAARSNVGLSALRSPQQIHEDAWPRVTAAAAGMHPLPLYFDETPQISVDQLSARCRQLHAQHGLRLVVVDYLQLMRMRNPDKLTQSIGEVTGALKTLAKELKLPILCLSQLNRGVEQRGDKRPMMSDLRESGSIEQDADAVMFLYRDDYYDRSDRNPHKGYAELIVAKQRNGPSGMVPLLAELQFCRFAHCDALPMIQPPESGPRDRPMKRSAWKGRDA